MREAREINRARGVVADNSTGDLSAQQKAFMCGMLVALCWVMEDENGDNLQKLMDGYSITKWVSLPDEKMKKLFSGE